MANINPKVMEFVENELKANPDARSSDLFEQAKKLEPSVAELSQRQFHARYPLQVHRKMAPPRPRRPRGSGPVKGRRRRAAAQAEQQKAVRDVLYKFAQELTASDEPGHLVKVMSNIDSYVNEVIAA